MESPNCIICKKETMNKCSTCGERYCSKDCQRVDWIEHKKRCYPLPVCYKDITDKDVYWICGLDQEKKITSVFVGHGERYSAYLPNTDEIKKQEELLKEQGWVKIKRPEINITFDNSKKD